MKTKLTKRETEAQHLIVGEIRKAVNLLIDTSQKYCNNNKVDSIPIIQLRLYKNILVENLLIGLKYETK